MYKIIFVCISVLMSFLLHQFNLTHYNCSVYEEEEAGSRDWCIVTCVLRLVHLVFSSLVVVTPSAL